MLHLHKQRIGGSYMEKWKYVHGNGDTDTWAKISPDGKTLLVGNYESDKDSVKRTIEVVKISQSGGTR